jgi:hypothetical protein
MNAARITPTKLMYAMGSKKGFDPIPPDQYVTFMDKRYPITMRLWAWLLSKTIGPNHFSPFAIDVMYRPLNLVVAEHELQVTRQPIRLAWSALEAEGRVRREGQKLFVCGEVTLPMTKSSEIVRTEPFANYILLQLNELNPEKHAEFMSDHKRDEALEKQVIADFTATVRCIFEQKEDIRFQRLGLRKIREEHPIKKNGDIKRAERVKKLVPFVEKFVEQSSFDFVQGPAAILHNAESEPGTESPSIVNSDDCQRSTEVSQSIVEGPPTDRSKRARPETPSDDAQLVRELLLTELRHRLPGETPTFALCGRIAKRLATAPLEFLRARIRQRLNAITSMGICAQLADDACQAWQEEKTERKRAIWARWDSASWYDADIQESARRALDDPTANDSIRAKAREILEFGMKQNGAGT